METQKLTINPEEFKQLVQDVAFIKNYEKNFLSHSKFDYFEDIKKAIISEKEMEETELTDWAKNELEEARKETDLISHEELKKELGL